MVSIAKINSADALNKVKTTLKSASKHVQDHKDIYIASAGVTVAGGLMHLLNGDKVEIEHFTSEGYEGDTASAQLNKAYPSLKRAFYIKNEYFKRFKEKISENLRIEDKEIPDGINTDEPFLTDTNGHYILNQHGLIPNPWFTKDTVNGTSFDNFLTPPTMEEFINNTGHNAFEEIGFNIPESITPTDIPDDDVISSAIELIKHLFDWM
ncbi:hypothetical protein IKQ21_01650 [bacterium]|nr:hypothetical protein [bacterium]